MVNKLIRYEYTEIFHYDNERQIKRIFIITEDW
mgnify:CR=1 FL=1